MDIISYIKAKAALLKAEQADTKAEDVRAEFDRVVAEAGENNPEVVQARGEAVNLNARLNASDELLAETVKKNESGAVTWAMAAQDYREQNTGGKTAVVGKDAVLSDNITNGAVTPVKTNFLKYGKNLFNPDTVTIDMTLSTSSGLVVGPSTGDMVSDFIKVVSDTDYSFSANNNNSIKIVPYDASKNPITSGIDVDNNNAFHSPVNAVYVRIGCKKTATNVQFEKGTTITPFEPFGYDFNRKIPLEGNNLKDKSIPKNKLDDKSVVATNIVDIPRNVVGIESFNGADKLNMFNKTTITPNSYVNNSGTLATSSALQLSDFIQVKEGYSYTVTGGYSSQGGLYNSDKQWIAKMPNPGATTNTPWTFQIPVGCTYIRCNVPTSALETWMVVPGNSYPSQYSPYGINVPWLNQEQPAPDIPSSLTMFDRWLGRKGLALGDSITWQDSQVYSSGQQQGEVARGYLTILREKLGVTIENTAKSGATMVNDGSTATPISVKGKEYDYNNYDFVTILGGTNDWGKGYTLGEIKSVASAFDDNTFCGAYQSLLEYIINSNNQIRIFMMTPMRRGNSDSNNAAGYSLKLLAEKVKEIGGLYGIPVLDLYNQSMFSELTFATYTKANDKVHPIDIGYERLSELIVPFVQTH